MAQRQVAVSILINARDLASKTLRGVRGSVERLRGAIFSMRTLIGVVFAGAVAKGVRSLFELGNAAEETRNKFLTVFGPAADRMQEFNDTFGRLAGLSREQGQALTATTGQIVQGLGFAQDASADFSAEIVKLAGDMASFNNAPTTAVLEAINSALTGIVVPLKQYGIVLRETDIQQKALAMTGKTNENQLTKQEKATAALALITQRAGVAVGDLERTKASMANTTRRVIANIQTAKETFGELFNAAFVLSGGLSGVEGKTKDFSKSLEDNRDKVIAWAAVAIKSVQFVISVFTNLVRVIWNVAAATADLAALTGNAIRAAFDPNLSMKEVWTAFKDSMVQNLRDIADSANDTGQALADVLVAGDRAIQAQRGKFKFGTARPGPSPQPPPQTQDAAAGTGQQKSATEGMVEEAATLKGKLDQGVISLQTYNEALAVLLERMIALRDGGKTTGAQIVSLQEAMTGLFDARQKAEAQVEVATPEQITLLKEMGKQLEDMFGKAETFGQVMAQVSAQFLRDFGGAIQSSFQAWVSGSESAGEAFKEAMLGAIASVASAQGQFYLAKAGAALGEGFLGNPAGFAAAAKFTAAAAMMFAIAGSLQGMGSRGGAAAGSHAADRADKLSEEKGEATLIIEGGFLDMTDPRQEAALAHAIESLSGRRVTVRTRRGRG